MTENNLLFFSPEYIHFPAMSRFIILFLFPVIERYRNALIQMQPVSTAYLNPKSSGNKNVTIPLHAA